MIFNIEHCTKYHYSTPVSTSLEYLRLTPITLSNQRVLEWNLDVPGNVQTMTDGYGNVLNVISIDTETTGLDPFLDNIVGICIYTPELKSAYIPINHISYITEQKCANQLPIDFLHDQFQRLVDANVKTIWFNAPFDIRFLQNKINVRFTPYFDTSVAAMCLNSDEPKGSGTLKALHKKYCWGDRGEALTFGKLFDNLPFNLIPIDVAYLYAASDAIYTYELYEFQAQYLEPTGQYYQSHHMEGVSNA